jgi:hypothetical protein
VIVSTGGTADIPVFSRPASVQRLYPRRRNHLRYRPFSLWPESVSSRVLTLRPFLQNPHFFHAGTVISMGNLASGPPWLEHVICSDRVIYRRPRVQSAKSPSFGRMSRCCICHEEKAQAGVRYCACHTQIRGWLLWLPCTDVKSTSCVAFSRELGRIVAGNHEHHLWSTDSRVVPLRSGGHVFFIVFSTD